MHIQWYPGHMTKAMRMMQEQVGQVDCVIYVLDSRAVFSCINPKFEAFIGTKPVLYVLNKSDLVESKDLQKWLAYFEKQGKKCIVADSVSGRQRDKIIALLRLINDEKIKRYLAKGAKKSIRAMVVGVPNTGKSTLVNSLCKSKKTVTGNKAGVTRGKQWVSLAEGIELLDTPGTLPPAFDDQSRALKLAFIGSIKDDILDIEELCAEMFSYFKQNNTQSFLQRYNMTQMPEQIADIFDEVAKSRGYILSGGRCDYARTARAVVDDFRKQKLGKIMLDTPEEL